MTRKEQDKRWAEHSKEVQQDIIERYNSYDTSVPVLKALKESLEYTFGEHNLKPKLKEYWEIEKELFNHKAAQWLSYYIIDWDKPHSTATQIVKSDCTSRKQAEKLLAINKLLNVAKFLNKNEDGSDWVLDWENMTPDEKVWGLGINENKIRVYYIQKHDVTRCEIVYFRTKELVEQAVQILGEDVVRTALTTEY